MGELSGPGPAEARELLGSQAPKLVTLVRGLDSGSESVTGGRMSKSVSMLARRLAQRLAESDHEARGLELRLGYEEGIADGRYTILSKPAATFEVLDRAGRRLLEMSPRRNRRITHISMTATGLTAKQSAIDQLSLFRHAAPRELAVHMSPGSMLKSRG